MTCARFLHSLFTVSLLFTACKGDDNTDTAASSEGGTTGGSGTTGGGVTTGGATTGGVTTGGVTTGGATTGGTTGGGATTGGDPVACDPMNLPAEGSPCASEGEYCSPGCEDPCQFCNVMQCTEGTWQGVEVFPAQCLTCDEVCPFVLQAACPGGPPDMAACVDGCAANQGGACMIVFNQMLACIGPTPSFSCDPMGRPTVVGCEAQFDALYLCIMP